MNEGWMPRKHPTKGYVQPRCNVHSADLIEV